MKKTIGLWWMGVLAIVAGRVQAADTRTWEFDQPTNYVYAVDLVEVTNSLAQLVLQAEKRIEDEFTTYSNAPVISNIAFDENASIQLTGTPGQYASNGVYTSRIMDLGTGNQLQGITLAASIGQYIVDTSARAYFPMENTYLDQVTGITGTRTGNINFSGDAANGSYSIHSFGPNYSFNRIAIPGSFPIANASAFTLAMYVKLDSYTDYVIAYGGFQNVSSPFFLLRQDAAAARSMQCIFTVSGSQLINLVTPVETNRWYHMVATWNGAGVDDEARRARLYLDGDLVRQSAPISGTLNYSGATAIAADLSANFYGWRGKLDDLLLLNRVMAPDEVQRLYEKQSEIFKPARLLVRSGPDIDTLQTRTFVGADATPNTVYSVGTTPFGFGPDLDAFDRYIQYQVRLYTDRNKRESPRVQGVRVLGVARSEPDTTFADRHRSEGSAGTVLLPPEHNAPFLGLSKQDNGGYYTNGAYVSGVFDAGSDVQWFQIHWTAAPELDTSERGLLALWRVNGNWTDSKSSYSVSVPQNAAYSDYAKAGLRAGLFNGVDNYITGFGSIGSINTFEFWVQSPNVDDDIFTLTPTVGVIIRNRQIKVTGLAPTAHYLRVNGTPGSADLVSGWNHVAVVIPNGLTLSGYTVGRGTGGDYFEGKLDEIAMYNVGLTDAEIKAHYIQGQREAGGQVKLQVSDSSLTNFVGPGANPREGYFIEPPATEDSPNLLGLLPAQRQIRYRIVFDGDGDATPIIRSVKLTTALPNSQTFQEDSSAEFSRGEFVNQRTILYGGRMALDDVSALGPLPFSAFDTQTLGIWHFDDVDWVTGARPVRAAKGSPGLAYGNAKPSFDARVGQKSGVFDGGGDYVDTIGTPVSVGSGDFSVSLWFKTSVTNAAPIFSVDDATRFFAVRLGDPNVLSVTGAVVFAVHDGTAERELTSPRGNYHDDQWHHVVGVRSGSQLLLYVDGRRQTSLLVPGLGSVANQQTYLVAKSPGQENYFKGLVDEVVVFSSAISEGTIGDHYAGWNRAGVQAEYQSSVLARIEPSIWQTLRWAPMAPYSKPLTVTADNDNLVAVWHFNEASGLVSNAVTVNGMHGTVSGASYRAPGRFDWGLNFVASESDYVEVANNALLQPATERITVEAWIYPRSVDDRAVVTKRSGSNGYALSLDASGFPTFWVGGSSLSAPTAVRREKWTHLAGVFGNGKMVLYVDGIAAATRLSGGSIASTAALRIGRNEAAGAYFDGYIDEVAVHKVPLGAEAVLDHYKAGAVTLKFQARSSTNETFSTAFVGPDRTTNSYFLLPSGSDMTTSIDPGLFYQYRVVMNSEDARFPPELRGVTVLVSGYPISNPTIVPTISDAYLFLGHLVSMEHVRLNNPNTDVRYQLSGDDGPSPRWFYWDTSAKRWTEETVGGGDVYTFQASSIANVASNVPTFYDQVYNKTGGVFRFRAFLHSTGETQAGLDWVRLKASPGRLVVTSPDGTENADKSWLTAVPYEITWDYTTNITGTVRLEYSTDRGANWLQLSPVAAAVPIANRTHTWTTPSTLTTQALVRIYHNDTNLVVRDQSDGTFTLREGLQVVDHNGGSPIWYIGETNVIRWRRSFQASPTHLEVSATGAFAGEQVRLTSAAIGTAALNSYTWVTPMTNAALVSETAFIRAIEQSARYSDVSDNPFVLAGGVVVAPIAGQGVKKDAVFNLQWQSAGMGPDIRIEIQSVPGGEWDLIDAAAPNVSGLNSYNWTPTNSPTDTARIRLLSNSDPRAQGLSLPFSIAAVELVSPLGHPDLSQAEIWLQNTTQTIAWISGGAGNFVSILYSTNSGAQFTTIVTNYPNINGLGTTNYYNWPVVPFPSETVRIRVEDESRPNDLFSVSPYNFQIAGLRVAWPNGPFPPNYWNKGETRDILWEENAVGFEGTIEFSDNGGVNWLLVARDPLLANHNYPFTPTNPTLNALVRITADAPAPYTNVFDVSDLPFAVAGIRVVNPDPVSEFTIGTTNKVRFVIAGTRDIDGVAPIYYSGDGIAFDFNSPINTPADVFVDGVVHEFNWIVEPFRRPSTVARLRVQAGPIDNPYFGLSEPFTLRGISFDSPVATTVWAPGMHDITWSIAGIAADATADMYLSLAGGAAGTYTNVIATDFNARSASFAWNVPAGLGPSTNARLRIVIDSAVSKPSDVGYQAFSSVFTLQGLRVLNPSSTSRWDMGSAQTIRWSDAESGPFVDLFYSPNGGTTYDTQPIRTFAPSANGTNTSPWTIEMTRTPSTNARVRAVSRSFPTISSESDLFRVNGIKVTRPTASDIYAITDATNLISWVGIKDGPGGYSLYFSANGGPEELITAGATSPYNWTIPSNAIANNVRIRVTDGFHSNTSATFRVVDKPTISLATPASGEFLPIGDPYTISWNRGGQMENDFSVYYSLAPYNVSNLISGGSDVVFDPDNNIFSVQWLVPDFPTQAIITIQHNLPQRADVNDQSAPFNIVGSFRLLNPPGPGNLFAMRPGTPIVWQTRGSVRAVDLYYSISPAHEAGSWNKINSSPITNNFAADGSWAQGGYSWTVANARTATAKVRVQEAAYPQLFEPGDDGPFVDSGEFPIFYYTVFWDVYDLATSNRLDHLSIVDSSGWAVADASAIPPSQISNDYPWGTFNTEIYREGFFDASILFWASENTDISAPGPRVWTQSVAMVRSLATEEYHVLANFSYDSAGSNFTIHAWMERGGVILDDPRNCVVTIYDQSGAQIDEVVESAPQDNGVFWLTWEAIGPPGSIYFAKVEIEYSGFVYSSGLTFTLIKPLSDELTAVFKDLLAATNLFAELTNVASIAGDIADLSSLASSGFTNLADLSRFTTNLLGDVKKDTELLTNEVISVIEPQLEALTNAITTVGMSSLARILTRPEAVARGSTNTILYKSVGGWDPGTVLLRVEAINGGAVAATVALSEMPISGLYEGTYQADWTIGAYRFTVTDPRASDSMVTRVVEGDLYALPLMLADAGTQLDTIETQLQHMSLATDAITNDVLPQLDIIELQLSALSTGDLSFIQFAVSQLTNQLATFSDMSNIAEQVALLTNSVGNIQAVTNLAEMVSDLTNALTGVDWQDVRDIKADVSVLTNDLAGADWGDVLGIQSDVRALTNAVLASHGMERNLQMLTNKLLRINFVEMEEAVTSATNILQGLSELGEIADAIGELSNSLTQISALTNMAPTIEALGTELLPIEWAQLEQNVQITTNLLTTLDGLDEIAAQIAGLSNALEQISAITNMSGQMQDVWDEMQTVDLGKLGTDMSNVVVTLEALEGLDAIAASIANLSNSLAVISDITNLNSQVDDIWAEMQTIDMTLLGADMTRVTNMLTGVNVKVTSMGGGLLSMSNVLNGVSRDLTTVTNKLDPFDWDVILGIQTQVDQIYTNIAALDDLAAIAADLQDLTNAIAQLAGITNLGTEVSDLTNALNGIDWTDVLYIREQVDIITNELTALDQLDQLGSISNSIVALTNSISALAGVTNISGQVDALYNSLADINFVALTNDVLAIRQKVDTMDWSDVLALRSDMQDTTNMLAGLEILPDLILAMQGLTNSIQDLSALTNLADQVDQIAAAVVGVDFRDMYADIQGMTNDIANLNMSVLDAIQKDVTTITNTLAKSRLDLLPGMQAGIYDISNTLSLVNFGLLESIQTDTTYITNTMSTLEDLASIAADLQNLTNAIADIGGITNLGADVTGLEEAINNVTNSLVGIDWRNITELMAEMDVVTNDLYSLIGVPSQIDSLSNLLGDVSAITNLGSSIDMVTTNLMAINWDDILSLQFDMSVTTNKLDALDALVSVAPAIADLSNSIEELSGITNLAANVDALTVVIADVTNSLVGIDWRDVTDIQTNVYRLVANMTLVTNRLDGLEALDDLTNAIAQLSGITNLSGDVSELTNAIASVTNALDTAALEALQRDVTLLTNEIWKIDDVLSDVGNLSNSVAGVSMVVTNIQKMVGTLTNDLAGVDWNDVLKIRSDVEDVTNSLSGLADLGTISGQLDALTVSLESVTNLSEDVASMSASLAGADWGDVTTMQTTMDTLSASLQGLDGADWNQIAGIEATVGNIDTTVGGLDTSLQGLNNADWTQVNAVQTSVNTMSAALQGLYGADWDQVATESQVNQIEAMVNDVNAELNSVSVQLDVVGRDAKNAAQRAQTAKSRAAAAAGGIQTLQTAIENGDLLTAMTAIREVQEQLRAARAEVQQIPKDVDPATAFATVRQMADSVNKLATSKGFQNLLNFETPAAGEAGGGLDADLARQLHEQIQEVRVGMEFMQELVDEMRYEPVVHESLLGVE